MGIRERQNERQSLERLVAMRSLYSSAERVERWRLVLVVAVVALPPLGLLVEWSQYSQVATMVVVGLWCVDQALLAPCAERRKEEAATIQEDFDCFVLDLPWPEHSGVERPTGDRVKEVAGMALERGETQDGLLDWYGSDDIPEAAAAARLHCQRTSCWWDERLRRRWICFVQSFAGVSLAVGFGLAVWAELSLLEAVLVVAAGLRLLAWLVMELRTQSVARKRARRLHGFLSRAGEQTEKLTLCDFRLVQARLFEHRRLSPKVPDWFYTGRKKTLETVDQD